MYKLDESMQYWADNYARLISCAIFFPEYFDFLDSRAKPFCAIVNDAVNNVGSKRYYADIASTYGISRHTVLVVLAIVSDLSSAEKPFSYFPDFYVYEGPPLQA
jgi:hypothetical protein